MKKLLLSMVALLSVTFADAQVLAGYKAVAKTPVPFGNAVVLNDTIPASQLPGMSFLSDKTAAQNKSVTGKGFPIGFDFPFNGKTMKYFAVEANGAVKLAETDSITMQSANNPHFVTTENGGDNTIFFYDSWAKSYETGNEAGKDTTTISYKSNSEELVVEFRNLGINTSSWSTKLQGTYTVEIHLLSDGSIKYVFSGLSDLAVTNAGSVFMGLRGDYGDFLTWNKGLTSTDATWQNASNFKLSAVADGYTVTLNAPEEVVAPTAQPTNLVESVEYQNDYNGGTSIKAGAGFDVAEGVDKYLVLISEGQPTVVPVDGTEYEKGDSLGNAYVMMASTKTLQNPWSDVLKHDTQYTITVYSYNSFGTGGAKYNTVNPLQKSFWTAPDKPAAFTLKSASKTALTFAATGNAAGQNIYVVYNDSTYNPNYMGSKAYTGTPDATKQAGDDLYDGETAAGKVAYFGPADEFTVQGLAPGTSYYFTAYSYNEDSQMFSQGYDVLSSKVWTSTNIVAPYTIDCSKGPDDMAMGGWTVTPEQTDMGIGFNVPTLDDANVTPQVADTRHWECSHSAWDDVKNNTVLSPVIECGNDNKITLNWHMHKKGSGWFGSPGAYDEWDEADSLAFYVVVDGEKVVLQKYKADNTPTATDEDETVWHSETFDLAAYKGKNVQFGIAWNCEISSNAWFSFENLQVTGTQIADEVKAALLTPASDNSIYNLSGQQVSESQAHKGVYIKNGKKSLMK